MPIIAHPTEKVQTRSESGYFASAFVVKCDFCGRLAKRAGEDPGAAAEAARKCGFITVSGATVADPRPWSCGCERKNG